MDESKKRRLMLAALRGIFAPSDNMIGTDIDNVQAFRVTECDFPQQSDGSGVHFSFSISDHAIGKVISEQGDEALAKLLKDLDCSS